MRYEYKVSGQFGDSSDLQAYMNTLQNDMEHYADGTERFFRCFPFNPDRCIISSIEPFITYDKDRHEQKSLVIRTNVQMNNGQDEEFRQHIKDALNRINSGRYRFYATNLTLDDETAYDAGKVQYDYEYMVSGQCGDNKDMCAYANMLKLELEHRVISTDRLSGCFSVEPNRCIISKIGLSTVYSGTNRMPNSIIIRMNVRMNDGKDAEFRHHIKEALDCINSGGHGNYMTNVTLDE